MFHTLAGQDKLLKACGDSTVHGLVGLFSWLIVEKSMIRAILCAIIAMSIDIDHFIQAGSLRLEDALNLSQRPFLHNSTLPVLLYVIFATLSYLLPEAAHFEYSKSLKLYTNLIFVAFASHHLRDASRRGLWFEPFAKSIPISYTVYIILDIVICILVRMAFFKFDHKNSGMQLPNTIKETL